MDTIFNIFSKNHSPVSFEVVVYDGFLNHHAILLLSGNILEKDYNFFQTTTYTLERQTGVPNPGFLVIAIRMKTRHKIYVFHLSFFHVTKYVEE